MSEELSDNGYILNELQAHEYVLVDIGKEMMSMQERIIMLEKAIDAHVKLTSYCPHKEV